MPQAGLFGLSVHGDPVAMLKVLILAAQNNVADACMEYLIRDRLSWLRFLGFDLGAPTPDANTIRLFREKLTEAGAKAREIWPGQPAKAAQKDTDARWTVKFSKGKPKEDGTVQGDIAIPSFGYSEHRSVPGARGDAQATSPSTGNTALSAASR
jgi:hypothetical protein